MKRLMIIAAALAVSASSNTIAQYGETDTGKNAAVRAASNLRTARFTGNLKDIHIAFKLDTRLTRSLYMGDRWVSPPTFVGTRQKGDEYTLEARINGIDTMGRNVPIRPEWILSDPEMVSLLSTSVNTVRITVKHAGESHLTLASNGCSKDLLIKATQDGSAMQVEIIQHMDNGPCVVEQTRTISRSEE